MKMSDFDKLHEHLRECVDSDNESFIGITEGGVEFNMYEFAFGLSVNAKREHDRLTEENEKLQADYDSLDKQAKQWLTEYKNGVEVAKKLREENEKLREALKAMTYEYAYVCDYVADVPKSYKVAANKCSAYSKLDLIESMVQLLEQTSD